MDPFFDTSFGDTIDSTPAAARAQAPAGKTGVTLRASVAEARNLVASAELLLVLKDTKGAFDSLLGIDNEDETPAAAISFEGVPSKHAFDVDREERKEGRSVVRRMTTTKFVDQEDDTTPPHKPVPPAQDATPPADGPNTARTNRLVLRRVVQVMPDEKLLKRPQENNRLIISAPPSLSPTQQAVLSPPSLSRQESGSTPSAFAAAANAPPRLASIQLPVGGVGRRDSMVRQSSITRQGSIQQQQQPTQPYIRPSRRESATTASSHMAGAAVTVREEHLAAYSGLPLQAKLQLQEFASRNSDKPQQIEAAFQRKAQKHGTLSPLSADASPAPAHRMVMRGSASPNALSAGGSSIASVDLSHGPANPSPQPQPQPFRSTRRAQSIESGIAAQRGAPSSRPLSPELAGTVGDLSSPRVAGGRVVMKEGGPTVLRSNEKKKTLPPLPPQRRGE